MGAETVEVSATAATVFAPSWGERINLADDRGVVAVVFCGGSDRQRAVSGAKDHDGGHEGGGEAESKGVSVVVLCEAEDHPPLTGARCVRPWAAITAKA